MVDIARRDLVFGGAFALFGLACYGLQPRRAFPRLSDDQFNSAIPDQVGPYRVLSTDGLILPPEDELSKKLYDKVITRVYVAEGLPPIMFLLAYGSTQNLTLQLHRPDECYPGQGFQITPLSPVRVAMGGQAVRANFLSATRPGRDEQILFWSRIGTMLPETRTEETLKIVEENFRGRMPDGMLFRLSIANGDAKTSLAQMTAFVGMLDAKLPPAGRRIMFGTGAA